MPTIACPGCRKHYKVPATAAGQTATCEACGKKFRISAAKPKAAAAAAKPKPKPKAKPAPVAASATGPAEPSSAADDSFWDDALSEDFVVEPPVPTPAVAAANNPFAASTGEPEKKKKKKRKKKVRWGVDWAKFGGGAAIFVIFACVTLGLVVATDRLFFWPAGIAVVGFFTMLSGLMGEEGIW